MLHVGVNGYGTIGKRVADAVRAQPEMAIAGVTKTSPDFAAEGARAAGYPLYACDEDAVGEFRAAGLAVEGTITDLIDASDVVVDATPGGVGAEYRPLYEAHDTPAVFQGAEAPDVAETSFNARANFEAARDADYVRVVSCNTTGLSRLIAPLAETYGVEKVRTTLVRRGGDPAQSERGPIDDILPDPVQVPSHHGPDVQTIFPDLSIDTLGLTVPATLMHLHSVNVTLESAPDPRDVRDLLDAESRLFVVPERSRIESCGELREYARDAGRPRGDVWENCVWGESITVEDRDFYCFQAIHQEADVVPENVDALRAMFDMADAEESVARTNAALGLERDGDARPDPRVAADD